MTRLFRRTLPLLMSLTALGASAQVYKLHNADLGVSGTGQFTKQLTYTSNGSNGPNQQFTNDSVGFVASLRDHPVAWAGIEINYGYTFFSQRYAYTYAGVGDTFPVDVKAGMHEATAAYMFHPHFFHLQPFVNVGGGALDFNPRGQGNYQIRGTGLLEVGFDVPAGKHVGFRFQGRSLYYRAPNFSNSQISTRSWVVTAEPSVGTYVRF